MNFTAIEEFVTGISGLDPASIGRTSFEAAVRRLMNRAGAGDDRQYLAMLQASPEERDRLLGSVAVPETWFFRDPGSFDLMRQAVREQLAAGRNGERVRILSAPCSTGEEPYSIVLALAEAGVPEHALEIEAVDISPNAIEAARRAIFPPASFRGGHPAWLDRYFRPAGGGRQLDLTLAGRISFATGNLASPGFGLNRPPYFIIFCRNLLIYLTPGARQRVVDSVKRLLVPGGWLFTGHAELSLLRQQGFVPVRHPRAFAARLPAAESGRPAEVARLRPEPRRHPVPEPEAGVPDRSPAMPPDLPGPPAGNPDRAMPILAGPAPELEEIRKLADRGDFGRALAGCNGLICRHPADPDAYFLAGLIHQTTGHLPQAEEFLLKALYLDPVHAEALVHLGLLCERRGDHRRAAIFRQRLERTQRSPATAEEPV